MVKDKGRVSQICFNNNKKNDNFFEKNEWIKRKDIYCFEIILNLVLFSVNLA